MEENEKNRLEQLKQMHENINRQNTQKLKLKKILFVFLSVIILALIIYFIMVYSGIINNTYSNFSEEFKNIYEIVLNENQKKIENPFYKYVGIKSSQREYIFSQEYIDIQNIINEKINEDFYIIDNSNQEQLNIEKKITGVYLVNYDKKIVFNLKPYVDEEKKEYILPEILELYKKNKNIDNSGANAPKLLTGMKPVKYNETLQKWEITTENDSNWYNYDNKKWANVILSDYEGEDISNASMFVWIPRYAYKISEDNYNKNNKGIIAIKFLKDNTNYDKDGNLVDVKNTKSNKDYVVHSAFNFNKELTGIWVSKYEASSLQYGLNGENYGGADDAELTYKSVADRYSWVNLKVDTTYKISKGIVNNPIYGLDSKKTDSHLIKNTEWGAVAYLANSRYGRNDNQIIINNYYEKDKLKTGYGATNNNDDYGNETNVTSLWNTEKGMKASTTGNVYGIYDLTGGAVERTAAYLNNKSTSLEMEALSLYEADDKYKDIYIVSEKDERKENYDLSVNNYGDAIYETSSNGDGNNSWYNANSYMTTGLYTFFYRGGSAIDGKKASLFYFSSSSGGIYKYAGFRAVLIEK